MTMEAKKRRDRMYRWFRAYDGKELTHKIAFEALGYPRTEAGKAMYSRDLAKVRDFAFEEGNILGWCGPRNENGEQVLRFMVGGTHVETGIYRAHEVRDGWQEHREQVRARNKKHLRATELMAANTDPNSAEHAQLLADAQAQRVGLEASEAMLRSDRARQREAERADKAERENREMRERLRRYEMQEHDAE